MTIKEFITKVLNNRSNVQEKYSLGCVSDEQAKKIKEQYGIEIHGYERVIENFGVLHAMKHHGNEIQEQSRGQIAITIDDFEIIPEITSQPDLIEYEGKSKQNTDLLKYEKRKTNNYIYVEEKRDRKKELITKTFYKQR